MYVAQVKFLAGRICTTAVAQAQHSELRLLRVPLGPSRELLAGHHLEARVASEDLVDEFRQALLVALDVVVLAMVKLREAQPLVGVEDYRRWQHGWLEERLVLGLDR